jgi:CRP/FNR family transcriptional regulator, anaerobic regulatory protein
MEVFLKYMEQFTPLSQEAKQAILSKIQNFNYPKGYVLTEQGASCAYLYYVKKGLSKLYYYKYGKEVVYWISDENTMITSWTWQVAHSTSNSSLKLLEDSELIGIRCCDLEELFSQFHEIERLGRLLASYCLMQVQEKMNVMQFETAKMRYEKLMAKHPTFVNRVPLGDIASYLGITQVTLSRIRAQRL